MLRTAVAAMVLLALPPVAAAAPGDLDPTFGGGSGRVTLAGGDAFALALSGDGSIVVGGTHQPRWAMFAHARLGPSGSRAPGYELGSIATPFGEINATAVATAVGPDDKLVLGGRMSRRDGGYPIGVIARFMPNGVLDASFGDGGIVRLQLAADERPEYVHAVAVDRAGQVLFAHSHGPVLGRLDSAGRVERILPVPVGYISSLVPTPDGGALAGAGIDGKGAVLRFTAEGVLDRTWGEQGIAALAPGAPEPVAVAAAPGGAVVATGTTSVGTENAFWAGRVDGSGRFDPSFGSARGVTTVLGTGDATTGRSTVARAIAVQADGSVLVAGSARFVGEGFWPRRGTVVRYRPDGRLDPSFGIDGAAIYPFGDRGTEYVGVAIQPNGAIVAAGLPDISVTRLVGDGKPHVATAPELAPTDPELIGDPTTPAPIRGSDPPAPVATSSPIAQPVSILGPPFPRSERLIDAIVVARRATVLRPGGLVEVRLTPHRRLAGIRVTLQRGRISIASGRRASLRSGQTATVRLKVHRRARLRQLTLHVRANGRTQGVRTNHSPR